MSLNLRPLLSALGRSPTGAMLVGLQIAITLAVLVNATWIVAQRIEEMEQPTGLDTRDTFGIRVSSLSNRFDAARAESADLAYLRRLPGVVAASMTVAIPLTGQGWVHNLWQRPGQHGTLVVTNVMPADDQVLRTLDVPLVAGRNFRADEIQPFLPGKHAPAAAEIIVTAAVAQALFPHGNALGGTIYDSQSEPLTIIGITRNFMGSAAGAGSSVYDTALLPIAPGEGGDYSLLVRVRPGERAAILRAAEQHIGAAHIDGVIDDKVMLAAAARDFQSDNRNMAIFLTLVTALMLTVCCLGIFGLATYNVGSRARQIGIRRAMGARKHDILMHFMVENSIVLTAGAVLGSVLALAIGDWLTVHYRLPRLDLAYLAAGVTAVWVVGQLAAWQPARRAASVPPSVATRTV